MQSPEAARELNRQREGWLNPVAAEGKPVMFGVDLRQLHPDQSVQRAMRAIRGWSECHTLTLAERGGCGGLRVGRGHQRRG